MPSSFSSSQLSRLFRKRDTIPLVSDSLWLLKKGIVKTVTWQEKNRITLGYWGTNDVVGLPLSQIQPYEIHCLTQVEATRISLQHHYWHSSDIIRCIQQTEHLLSLIRCERVAQRFYKILVWLSQKFGRIVQQGCLIDLLLTHQELADIVGTTRVSITRLLNQFEQEGIICRTNKYIILQKIKRESSTPNL